MALGAPKSARFPIGTFEVRIGPMSSAGKLTAAHSIGLVDSVTLTVEQNSVDLLGGFPQIPVDTAITSQVSGLTATLREYSKRNLDILLGNGVASYDTSNVNSLVDTTSQVASGATTITLTSASGFTAGDIIVIYEHGKPENMSFCKIASIAVNVLTLDSDLPTTSTYAASSVVTCYKAATSGIGSILEANYFAVQLLQLERGTNRPYGFNFWKGTIANGMTYGAQPTEFGSTELALKFLIPSAAEYSGSGSLLHLADIIPTYPVGLKFGSSDGA